MIPIFQSSRNRLSTQTSLITSLSLSSPFPLMHFQASFGMESAPTAFFLLSLLICVPISSSVSSRLSVPLVVFHYTPLNSFTPSSTSMKCAFHCSLVIFSLISHRNFLLLLIYFHISTLPFKFQITSSSSSLASSTLFLHFFLNSFLAFTYHSLVPVLLFQSIYCFFTFLFILPHSLFYHFLVPILHLPFTLCFTILFTTVAFSSAHFFCVSSSKKLVSSNYY